MSNIGGLDDVKEEKEEKVINMQEDKKARKAFHYWTVSGYDYKLKLKASTIERLENKYKKNIGILVLDDEMPPLSIMLTVAQAAMQPWEHGVSYEDIKKLYDKWVEEEDGNQTDFYSKVIIPVMAVSGFFTVKESQEILEKIEDNA